MSQKPIRYRKKARHYHDKSHCHELTFSCYRRLPLLTNDLWRSMLSQAIDRATLRHDFHLAAFVYMPNHVHLLVIPGHAATTIDKLLHAIKRPFSVRIKRLLGEASSPLLKRLTIRQRPGVSTFRFWQEGPGYDRNLDRPDTVLAAIDYIHRNPVRRGLVQRAMNWHWSSARWYQGLASDRNITIPCLEKLPPEFFDQSSK